MIAINSMSRELQIVRGSRRFMIWMEENHSVLEAAGLHTKSIDVLYSWLGAKNPRITFVAGRGWRDRYWAELDDYPWRESA